MTVTPKELEAMQRIGNDVKQLSKLLSLVKDRCNGVVHDNIVRSIESARISADYVCKELTDLETTLVMNTIDRMNGTNSYP